MHMYGAAVLALRGNVYLDPITSQVGCAPAQQRRHERTLEPSAPCVRLRLAALHVGG